MFLTWCSRDQLLDSNPAEGEIALEEFLDDPGTRETQQFWSPDDRRQLESYVRQQALDAIKSGDTSEKRTRFRQHAIVALLAHTGVPGAEIFAHPKDDRRNGVTWADSDWLEPRAELTQNELGKVNEQAMQVAADLDRWTRAAVSRRLAEAVLDSAGIPSAVLDVKDKLETAPGQALTINRIGDVDRQEVSIEGTVTELWDSDSPAIAQVGLIADESGKTKFTSWVASDQP